MGFMWNFSGACVCVFFFSLLFIHLDADDVPLCAVILYHSRVRMCWWTPCVRHSKSRVRLWIPRVR